MKVKFNNETSTKQYLNPYIRGRVNYYGKFKGYEMNQVFSKPAQTISILGKKTVQVLQNKH